MPQTTSNGDTRPNLADLREQVERARLERQLKAEQKMARLMEHAMAGFGTSAWGELVDPREPYDEIYASGMTPLASLTPADRQKGMHYVAFQTEQELAFIRDVGRYLGESNVYALGAINALANKVVRNGFMYRIVAKKRQQVAPRDLQVATDVLERFRDDQAWPELEREIFVRSRIEGERAIRYFAPVRATGVLQVRTIEPEQILQPEARPASAEWAFGVHCDPFDVQTRLGYWVSYEGGTGLEQGEEVPASEVEFIKINTPRLVRRGLSDFFSVAGIADELSKLTRNLRVGAALLAAIAWIEQFETASKSQVEAFADDVKEYSAFNPRTGRNVRHERIEPGTIVRTAKGKTYQAPPLATANTPQLIEIARLSRLALATRWNAPEVIFGDAANGSYASLAVAESPFVLTAEVEQSFYARHFRRVMLRALRAAVEAGVLSESVLDAIDVHVEPPSVVVRNRLEQAQENAILLDKGIMSPQTWAQIEGLDFAEEQQEIAQAKAMGWAPAVPPTIPAGSTGLGGTLGEGRVSGPFGLWRRLLGR